MTSSPSRYSFPETSFFPDTIGPFTVFQVQLLLESLLVYTHIITAIGHQIYSCRGLYCLSKTPRDALVRRSPGWAPATGRPVRSIQSHAARSSVDREEPVLQCLVSQRSRRSLVEMADLLDRRGNWLLVAGAGTQCRHCVSTTWTATGLSAER